MARGIIVVRELGSVVPCDDGRYAVLIRGKSPKIFANKKDAKAHLSKTAEKRYDACIRVEGRKLHRTFERKRDAEGWLDRNSTDIREHVYRELIPATFREYSKRWREKYLTIHELKPSTLSVYNYLLDHHLIERFAPRPMAAITTADITDFRAELLKGKDGKKGQSSQSVKKLMNLLNRLFGDAIEDGYLRVNPMPTRRRKADKSGKSGRRGKALQYTQAQRLLEQCDADPDEGIEANPDLRLVMLIGLLAGLRRGEIFGLHWQDVDFDKDLIHVRHNLFWRYGKHHPKAEDERIKFTIYSPKSEASARDVDLSPALKKELRTRFLKAKDKHGLIFQSREKTPLDPKNIYARWFVPAVERARKKAEKEKDNAAVQALDGLHMHDLRHTFGSWKVAEGEDIIYVAAQMGHARPSITADIYSHLLEKRRPHAAAKTDDFLFGKVAAATE